MIRIYSLMGMLSILLLPFTSTAQYCSPSYSSGCQFGDYIAGVQFVAISNTGTTCSPANYGNYIALSTNVNQSLTYTMTITNCPSYGEGFGVFIDWNQDGDFVDAGEFFGNGNVTGAGGTENISITVPMSATLGNTRMRVTCNYASAVTSTMSCGGTTYGEAEDYTLNVQAAPACGPATALNTSGITATTANLNWTAASGAVDYIVEWGSTGFSPGTGTQAGMASGVTGTTTSATSLSPQTTYQFYVRTNCGSSTSPWAGPVSFTTPCVAVMAPWTDPLTTTTTPACWNQTAGSGGPWVFTGNPGYDAAGTLDHTSSSPGNYAWIDHSGTDVGVSLITPMIDVSALSVPELRFWVFSHYGSGSLTPFNPTYVEAYDGSTWQPLLTVQGDFGPQWKEFNVVIPASYISNNLTRIRFRAESGGSTSDFYNDILLDDISVIQAPTCPAPTNLSLISASTSDVSYSWTTTGSESTWAYQYGPVGFTPGTGTSGLTTTNPDTISGLAPNSFYHLYIRAVCTPGDTSFLLGPLTFNTYDQGQYMEYDAACDTGFIDITATGTNLFLTDDSEAGITLPFPWLYQGTVVNQITVGNNGGILMNTLTGNVGYTMVAGYGLYPFAQDLDNDINNVDQVGVLWEVQGTAPNRKFIVMWKNRTHYPGTTYQNPVTFELIYEEGSNEIYYLYPDVDFGVPSFNNGGDAEIGVRGSQNINISINSPVYLSNNSCVHLYYTDCPKPTNLILGYTAPDEAAYSWTAGLSNEASWIVVYGLAGFDPATGGLSPLSVSTPDVTLTGLQELTYYDVYIYAVCASGDTSLALFGSFQTKPYCADVSSLSAVTSIDSVFSAWSWTASAPLYPATGFDLHYGSPGFDPATEGMLWSDDNQPGDTIADPGFMAGGVYHLYVRSICDTLESNYVGPISFTMPLTNDTVCGAQLLPVDGVAYSFSNAGATISGGELGIAPPATGAQTNDGWINSNLAFTTWFKFQAPPSGQIRISGVDQGYNGQMALYQVSNCGDFSTFNLIAANDNEIDGASLAPNFTWCALTPGTEYFLMHDAFSNTVSGIYSIKLSAIDLEAGASTGLVNLCSRDTINLFSGIAGYDPNGTWLDIQNTYHLVNDSLFSSTGLAYETFMFEYRLVDGCAMDSVVASFEVYPPSKAGTNGSLTICKNEAVGLLEGLGGVITAGGTWYDPNSTAIASSQIPVGALSIPGSYNYQYIVGNGVCPDDSSVVTVIVSNTCDFLSIDELSADGFELYPNPTNTLVYLSNSAQSGVYTLSVLDMKGRVLQKATEVLIGAEPKAVDLESYDDGIYLIRIERGGTSKTLRLIKQ